MLINSKLDVGQPHNPPPPPPPNLSTKECLPQACVIFEN